MYVLKGEQWLALVETLEVTRLFCFQIWTRQKLEYLICWFDRETQRDYYYSSGFLSSSPEWSITPARPSNPPPTAPPGVRQRQQRMGISTWAEEGTGENAVSSAFEKGALFFNWKRYATCFTFVGLWIYFFSLVAQSFVLIWRRFWCSLFLSSRAL